MGFELSIKIQESYVGTTVDNPVKRSMQYYNNANKHLITKLASSGKFI